MRKGIKGISLIEILIVIGIFAVLGILSTRVVLLSLSGAKKGDAQIKVRENVDYAISIMERQLRNAGSITPCPNLNPLILNYNDSSDAAASFSCLNMGSAGYIASGSARLTSDEVKITSCSFVCSAGTQSAPPKVSIDIQAVDAASSGSKEGASVSISTEINLRTY